MAKRGRKKKNKIDINIAVVALVLLSILLMILIYTKSGSIGETLSPMLGGIMGFIKYIIPIGTLLIAIYMTQNDKEYMTHKLIQYGIFLLCVAAMLSIFQVGKGNLSIDKEFDKVIEDAYYLGEKDIGGGAIGAAVAVPLIKALGSTGAVILTIGIAVILLIFMFGIRPAEMISDLLDELRERKEEKKKDGNHDSDNHFYSSSADNTFVAFQHDDSGKGDDDEADCENIRKVSPPLSGVVVQACHCSDERAAGDRFVDCLSRTDVYLQVGPAFQEYFHDVRFREIVLGIVAFLSQWLQQSQYIFPFHSLFARQFFGNLIFFPFDGEVRVDGVTVIHHNAGNGINQDHSGKEKG